MMAALVIMLAAASAMAAAETISVHDPDRPSSIAMRLEAVCLGKKVHASYHTIFGAGAASKVDDISIGDRKIAADEVSKLSPPAGALIEKVFIATCGADSAEGYYVDIDVTVTDASALRAGIPRSKTYRVTNKVVGKY